MPPLKVLIMDNYGPDFNRVARALRPFGLALMWTESLKDGLNLMAQAKPIMVLVGQNLPELSDPKDLLSVIQAKRLPTQLVVMSPEPNFDQAMDWVADGVFSVISSPVNIERLRKVTQKILDNLCLYESLVESKAKNDKPSELLIYKTLAGHTEVKPMLETLCDTAMTLTGAGFTKAWTGADLDQINPINVFKGNEKLEGGFEKTLDFHWMGRHLASLKMAFPNGVSQDDLDRGLLDELAFAGSLFLSHAVKLDEALILASKDPLTGLSNRRVFLETLNRDFFQSKRHSSPLTLLTLDLDHFKDVNDTYGHQTGDEILKWLSGVITSVVRLGDLAARTGGEEFSILLPRTNLEQGTSLAKRLKEALSETPLPENCPQMVRPTISQGLASLEHFLVKEPQDLIYWSDQAMYLAKREGRDTIKQVTELSGNNHYQDVQYVFQ
ncbi:MAG: diguanylate cyclase [Deltaproteobacteria bacterium]|jgi:diguanylate cyclase (GGDEF)-like protein|nr:diguanylate cyclase [Deltaproteobacteria bacterium]